MHMNGFMKGLKTLFGNVSLSNNHFFVYPVLGICSWTQTLQTGGRKVCNGQIYNKQSFGKRIRIC
jgi:hypothetical protein